ncbi:MAG: SRPBCC family protein [bacterium]
MYIENSIVIKANVDKVFEVMADVEKWHEFMLHHKRKVKILSREQNKLLIERDGIIKWKASIIIDRKNKLMKALHLAGVTKGLLAIWKFEEIPEGTKMTLSHTFIPKIPFFGRLKWLIIKKGIERINSLKAVKEKVEG